MALETKDLKILCIDDEEEVLKSIVRIVTELGFQTLETTSPKEALELISKHSDRIALVVSDYKMEEMNGLELRKLMLPDHAQIPYLVVSGFITKEMALEGIEYRIQSFVDKPFSSDSLKAIITKESTERITLLKEEDELLQSFIVDAENLTEEMERHILSLETDPTNQDTLNRIFAQAHTIKGSSGFFKPDTLHRFTHRYEDYLSHFKKKELSITPESITTLLTGLDTIKNLIRALKENQKLSTSLQELTQIFKQTHPETERTDKADPNQTQANPQQVKKGEAKREEIRVDTKLLDDFMELSGEITVIRNMINKLVRSIEKENPGNKNVSLLSELLSEMHRINGMMQDKIIDLRKVPLKNVFRPLSRIIRDLSKNLKKEINLEFIGDHLRVDTSLAEILSNSLIHMVRNSADHGLELPEERKSLGKNPEGKIVIECKETVDDIIVKISDDGRGINPEKVASKLIEKGIKTPEEISKMTPEQIQMMIFEPSFSTAASVSDVSGRGVGTDMVKKAVTDIGGNIELHSLVNQGSVFVLRLPIPRSVLIMASLMIKIGEETFAIPQEFIMRLLHLTEDNQKSLIKSTTGANFIEINHSLIPIVDLNFLLTKQRNHLLSDEDMNLVLLKTKSSLYGIKVDEILDVEDTVVKRLGRNFKNISAFGGATFLGDGKLGLILDIDGISRMNHVKVQSFEQPGSGINSTKSENTGKSELLLFELDTEGTFAAPLNDIFRLEEINAEDIQLSGQQPVVIYRDTTMPILCTGQALEISENPVYKSLQKIPTLVLKQDQKFFGLAVKSILDLSFDSVMIDTGLASHKYIKGSCILNGETITVIDLIKMIKDSSMTKKPSDQLTLAA